MNDDAIWHEAVQLFNEGEFWECHEVLEPLWLKATDLDKHFLAGVILLAAALHKARAMNSARGGRRNYAKALAHLALIPDVYTLDLKNAKASKHVKLRTLESLVHSALIDPGLKPYIPMNEEGGRRNGE